jgi:hypothetical protein
MPYAARLALFTYGAGHRCLGPSRGECCGADRYVDPALGS